MVRDTPVGSKEASKATSNQTQQLNPLNQLSQRTNKTGDTHREGYSDNNEDVFTVKGIMPAGSEKPRKQKKHRQHAESTGNTMPYSSPAKNTMEG